MESRDSLEKVREENRARWEAVERASAKGGATEVFLGCWFGSLF